MSDSRHAPVRERREVHRGHTRKAPVPHCQTCGDPLDRVARAWVPCGRYRCMEKASRLPDGADDSFEGA